MVHQTSLLVTLIALVDRIPLPSPAGKCRGRPKVYPDRLFLKALLIMILRHLSNVNCLLTVLAQPTDEMRHLRSLLTEQGLYPCTRTFRRRLKAIPDTMPAQIACLGRYLVALIVPWRHYGRAAVIDSTVLRALGGVWHRKHRQAGVVPHGTIDTEAHWTNSGWHGWVYGWKLHLVACAAAVWIPLAAVLTAANAPDSEPAPALIRQLPMEVRFLLGDVHYHGPGTQEACAHRDIILVTSHNSKGHSYPHTDPGVPVRRVFHKIRSVTIENFNEHFKGIFDGHGSVPTRGLCATSRFVLGAVFTYQLVLLHQYLNKGGLRVGLKPLIKAA